MLKRAALFVFALALFAASASAQQNPLIGTWKMNIAKSKFEGDAPPTTPAVARYEMTANGEIKQATDGVNLQGQKTHTESVFKADGNEYPLSGNPYRDGVAVQQIDKSTFQWTYKKGGKVVTLLRRTFSPDGKTMTSASTGLNPNGKFTHDVIVWERQ